MFNFYLSLIMKPYFIIGLLSIVLFSCSSSDSVIETEPPPTPTEKLPINISSSVSSSAIDLAFEVGDSIGLYVVNHNADGSVAALQVSGNYVDNMQYTYNSTWTPATQTYWIDNSTHADFYLYYPYTSTITSIDAMPYSLKANQSQLSDYKAGDLMIGKTIDVAPTQSSVKIEAKHVMSQMTINLVAGNGFTDATLAAAKISVKVNRLKTKATANIATGAVTAIGDDTDIIPYKVANNSYKAIVVPQLVGEGNLITITVDGRDFNLPKTSNFTGFEAGKKHNFNVTLSKTSNGVNVNISKWEDDGNDYGGTAE